MSTLYTQKENNILKTWFLMAMFFVLITAVGWALSYMYGNPTILYGAVFLSLFMNILSYWFSDKIVLSMAHAREAKREEFFDLYNSVENLSITAGLPMPKVYVIDDASPNAFATGRNEKHAVVAVTTGLLKILNKVELEGVIAHELAHVKNRDILLQTVVVVLVNMVTIVADIMWRSSLHGKSDNKQSNMIFILIGIALMVLAPIASVVIQLAISRKREFLADSTGALLTRYPEGLASALEKISASHIPLEHANNATAHLYISDPFANDEKENEKEGKKTPFLMKLFMTHPPVEERVAALRGIEI